MQNETGLKQTTYIYAKSQIRMAMKKGVENALTRDRLKQITGMDDRTNRVIIEDLRLENMPIVSMSSQRGYWLPEKKSEIEHYIHEQRKRARECDKKADIAYDWCKEHEGELIDV